MSVSQEDFEQAIVQLQASGIVVNKKYKQVFSGHFSSFGPDLSNGVLTAIALYEGKPDIESGMEKAKVCIAILNLVKAPGETDKILFTWAKRHLLTDTLYMEHKLEKAIIALKIALRLFEEVK